MPVTDTTGPAGPPDLATAQSFLEAALDALAHLGYDTRGERKRMGAAFGDDPPLVTISLAQLLSRVAAQYTREAITLHDGGQEERVEELTETALTVGALWDADQCRSSVARAWLTSWDTQTLQRTTGYRHARTNAQFADLLAPEAGEGSAAPDLLAGAIHQGAVAVAAMASLSLRDEAGADKPLGADGEQAAAAVVASVVEDLGRAGTLLFYYAYPRGLAKAPRAEDGD